MGGVFARQELDMAGFPARTRELVFAAPIEELAGDATELELEVHVSGVDGDARMSVGYLPGGPVTAGQQLIRNGESRVLRKQLVKPGAVLVVVLDQPGHVDVRVAGAHGYDEDAQLEALAGEDDVDAGVLGYDEDAQLEALAGEDGVDAAGGVLGADDSAFELLAKQANAMDAAIKDLTELNLRYFVKVSTTIDVGSGGSAKDAALGLHKQFTAAIDSLAGPQRQRVINGDAAYPYARWVKEATDLHTLIAKEYGDTAQWGILGMLSSVGGDTAQQVAELAKDAAPKVESNLHWLVIGAVALAVVMVFK